ncbi:DMT family transporter [Sporomusa aerivorans]|uniref:DMT family transporter n=1 Tax=Sporomusa aerivorans TaxID=204936 RepID=UPI00352A1E2F
MTQEKTKQLIGIACVNLATLTWASNMVLGRLLKDAIGPITLSSVRFCVAALIFALLLKRQPAAGQRMGKDFWLLAAMAVTGVVLFSPILYWGLHYTTAVNGTIINGLAPLITGLFATWVIHEPMSGRQMTGALLALAGVLFLVSGGSWSFWQTAGFNIGDLIILAAVALWGLYSLFSSRVMRQRSSVSATALSIFIGLPALILLAVLEMQHVPVQFDARLLLLTVYLGVVPGAFGFYAWNAGVARLGAGGAMVFYNTLPLYGALLGYIFLDEAIGLPHIIGGLLIISGGIWAARQPAAGTRPALEEP